MNESGRRLFELFKNDDSLEEEKMQEQWANQSKSHNKTNHQINNPVLN